jgi:uncharacterized membrane protein YtjA (UPF0391 family)
MLMAAFFFLLAALAAALFGYTGIAENVAPVAQIFVWVFLILFAVLLIVELYRKPPVIR